MTGTVVYGAEPGCLLLDAGFERYVLLGGDRASLALAEESSKEVTVTGESNTPTPTPCTEGIPLAVTAVTPAT